MATIKVIGGIILMFLYAKQCYSDLDAMFLYGPSAGDTKVSRQGSGLLEIDLRGKAIVFYGKKHRTLALANHGTFYFTPDSDTIYHPDAKPPDVRSPPFAAPLYFNAGFLSDPKGVIYYRMVEPNTQTAPTLNDLNTLMRGKVVGTNEFIGTFAIIATWVNITDVFAISNCVHQGGGAACENLRRNTFQCVLLANSQQTFVIFNYAQVSENAVDAHAGFSAGDRMRWTPVLPNNQRRIIDLESVHGTNDAMGRFIFKVSEHEIVRGGCYTGLTNAPLAASPTHAGMYGGEIIEVSGPCLSQQQSVQCRFGDTTVVGTRINDQKASCVVPLLKQRGQISLSLSASTPPEFIYFRNFTVVLPGRLQAGVITDYLGPDQGWNETDAGSLTLHWDTARLSNDAAATVQVNLIGYREDDTQAYWEPIVTLAENVPNNKGKRSDIGLSTGVTFKPADFRCTGEQCQQYELGIVEVKLTNGQYNTHGALYSHNLPLGWFIKDAMEQEHGSEWPSVLCTKWDEADMQDTAWIDELLNCPCTMDQAMADFGRWQPDVGCNIFTGSKCTYHQGAVHCVRSVQPTQSGAGNQCCYSADGNLKYAADSFQGSTPDKGHAWGAAPYIKPGYVPEESHWVDDVVTFYYCCLWTDYKDCDKYMNRRPTKDCLNYLPPGSAIAYGDPHITSFDGLSYRFHGRGEFTLLNVGTFRLQGRFLEPVMRSPINFNVSVLTAIALIDSHSTKAEVHLTPVTDGGGLMVMVNQDHLTFHAEGMYWQDFKGLSVVTKGEGRADNVTILMSSGIGVQVAENRGLLNVIVSLPPGLKNGQSRGLLGVWDGDRSNDYLPSTDTSGPVDITSANDYVYTNFASTWRVNKGESIFGAPENHDQDKNFVPTFGDPTDPPADVQRVCNGNLQCEYDYTVTRDEQLASGTYTTSVWYATLQRYLQPVATCGLLDVPYSEKDSYDYMAGSTIHITGCRLGKSLQGDMEYTCDSNTRRWNPEVTAQCSGNVADAGLGMKIGIGVGVVGGVALLVIVIIIVVRVRNRGKSKGKGSESSAGTEMKPRVPGRSEYSPTRTSEDIEDLKPKAKPRTRESDENSA